MSKVWYDHLLDFDKLEKKIKSAYKTHEERVEIFHYIDEIIHHRVMGCVLDNLPAKDHKDFIDKFFEKPHSHKHVKDINKKIKGDIELLIKHELNMLSGEFLRIIGKKSSKKKK